MTSNLPKSRRDLKSQEAFDHKVTYYLLIGVPYRPQTVSGQKLLRDHHDEHQGPPQLGAKPSAVHADYAKLV